VELKGTSADVLTANRDYLKGEHAESINRFLAELAVDKKSALKPKGESRRRYPGARYVHAKPRPATERKAPVTTGAPAVAAKTISVITFGDKGGAAPTANTLVVPTANPALVLDPARPAPAVDLFDEFPADAGPVSQLAEEFVIVNETEYAIPDYYLPDSPKFTAYSRRLVKTWGRLLLELHRMENHEADFALGFVFDETTEAMFEKGADGRVYYVNPAKLEYAGGRANRKVFKNRWATTGRNELLALAAHEFVHGLGYERHDELYAGKLTDLMGKVLNCRRRFDWCFKP
jgi:PAS domain-containing protein